jgi:hypothetical protein
MRRDDHGTAARPLKRTVLLKNVLDSLWNFVLYGRIPSAGGRSREASSEWDGNGARGRGHANPGLGRPEANSGVPAYLGSPPSDPTALHYDGAAEKLEADREKAGASDLCEGQKL